MKNYKIYYKKIDGSYCKDGDGYYDIIQLVVFIKDKYSVSFYFKSDEVKEFHKLLSVLTSTFAAGKKEKAREIRQILNIND